MTLPLMPKATAVWLIENTTLTFEQIAEFCGMHTLEVQGIADGDVATGVIGVDPIANHQLGKENLDAAQEDASVKLRLLSEVAEYIEGQKLVKKRYTPVARRQDKPDAILWCVKNHPELSDAQIVKLIGSTKNTIQAIREKEHWNYSNIRSRDPVLLGLCSQTDLEAAIAKAEKKAGKKPAPADDAMSGEPEAKAANGA